jgi:GntR family transcriptional regulator, histidine utilization repressor
MSASDTMPLATEQSSAALYERVKAYIRQKARLGEWKPGDRIPSENDLVRILGVSRMTINRALRELSEAGELVRRGGVGTFVVEPRPNSTLLMIARIGDEIRARGHRYHWKIVLKTRLNATAEIAAAMELADGSPVFHLVCVHYENDVPVQLEDRYVNPVGAPYFLEQTFETQPPGVYLLDAVPADEIEHTVDSVLPGAGARLLKIDKNEPCLLLTRRTWSGSTPVTYAKLLYPASRYRLSCRFKPSSTKERG